MLISNQIKAIAVLAVANITAAVGKRGWITLVNSTPYKWQLVTTHRYQMRQWQPLQSVDAGVTQEFYYEYSTKTNEDDAAEASYAIEGHPRNASFTIQARTRREKRIEVQFQGGLSSLNNPEGTLLDIGREEEGTVPFILAGDGLDIPLISNNPPTAWMQATLHTIGQKSLREICLLASHDSGASEITRAYMGVKHNVLTQSNHVYQQLISGARYLDIRPALRKGTWYTAHLTIANQHTAFGSFTRTIKNIVADINQFNAEHRGELIVVDISHDVNRQGWKRLTSKQWQDLYMLLSEIQNLWLEPEGTPEDITSIPLSAFIQPGSTSAVVLRVPHYAPLPNGKALLDRANEDPNQERDNNEDFSDEGNSTTVEVDSDDVSHPLARPAAQTPPPISTNVTQLQHAAVCIDNLPVIRTTRFPFHGRWSNTLSPAYLARDQLRQLHEHRYKYKSKSTKVMLRSVWTITQMWQQVINVGVPKQSILSLSVHARREMYKSLWEGMRVEGVFPNMIEVDDIWGRGMVAFVMAVNEKFASGSRAAQGDSLRTRKSDEPMALEGMHDEAVEDVKTEEFDNMTDPDRMVHYLETR